MFDSYEEEFKSLLVLIREGMASAEASSEGRERRQALEKCQVDLSQAESLLRQLSVEARSSGGSASQLKKRVASQREALKEIRQDFASLKQRMEREELMGSRESQNNIGDGSYSRLSNEAREDRSRFEQVTARLERSTDSLLESRRTLDETEQVALSITENLASNRATIINTHERITATSGLLGGASQILRRMRQRETRRKMILAALIGLMIFVIIIVFVFALRPTPSPSPSPASHSET